MTFDRGRAPAAVAIVLAVAVGGGCASTAEVAQLDDPAQALLEVAWSDPTPDRARMEQLVADCMADAGFSYVPADGGPTAAPAPDPDAPGYGITSGPHPSPAAADPNAAGLAAMTPDDRAAYWVALDGASDDAADDVTWEYDWRSAGCRGLAQNQVYGDPAGLDGPAALEAELDRARLAAESDPRVAELDAAWATCMAAAGHADLASADAAEAAVQDAWAALWAQAWSTLPADASPADVSAAEEAAQPSVRALATQEAEIATADRSCRDAVGYDAARAAVAAEYRERFYTAHRTALREWAAAAEVTASEVTSSGPAASDPAGR